MSPVNLITAVGKAVADGLALAAEILCPRDHTAEERLRSWESAAVAVEGEICDEAEACEGVDLLCTCGHPSGDHYRAGGLIDPCGKCDCLDLTNKSSAAVSAAADPSPADFPAAGGEGSGGASDILQSAPPEQPDMHPDAVYGRLYVEQARQRKSDPGAVSTPAPGERFPGDRQSTVDLLQAACYLIRDDAPVLTAKIRARVAELQAEQPVREDDLAAHIMGDFVSGQEVDPLTATLIDAISSHIARCLLADFHITRN